MGRQLAVHHFRREWQHGDFETVLDERDAAVVANRKLVVVFGRWYDRASEMPVPQLQRTSRRENRQKC